MCFITLSGGLIVLKKFSYLLLFVILSVSVFGVNCEENFQPLTSCQVVTPTLFCDGYNVYFNNGSLYQSGNLSVYAEDTYYFNFSAGNGEYLVILCDGSTKTFFVNYYNLSVFGESFNWLAIISIFVVISVLCLWISRKINNKDLFLFKTLLFFYGLINSFMIVVLTLFISSGSALPNFNGFFNVYTIIVVLLLSMFVLYYAYYMFIQAIKSYDGSDKK